MRPSASPLPPHLHRLLSPVDPVDAARPAASVDVGSPRQVADRRAEGSRFLCVEVPIRTVSAINAREHWAVRAKRVKVERRHTFWRLADMYMSVGDRNQLVAQSPVVKLTRIAGPRGKTLDDDNIRGCLKAVRDGVADWLGIQDNDPRVSWEYGQEKGRDWAVRIEVFT